MVARVHGVEAAARVPATASAFVAMLTTDSHVAQGVQLMWLLAGVLSAERTARPFFLVFCRPQTSFCAAPRYGHRRSWRNPVHRR